VSIAGFGKADAVLQIICDPSTRLHGGWHDIENFSKKLYRHTYHTIQISNNIIARLDGDFLLASSHLNYSIDLSASLISTPAIDTTYMLDSPAQRPLPHMDLLFQ
jgi:hypothetical protein